MYLRKRVFVKEYSDEKQKLEISKNGKPIKGLNLDNVSSIEEEAAYWRKANQIHNWFVENVQEGVDDCGTYYVEIEKLQELVDLCKKVITESKLEDGKIINGREYRNGVWTDIIVDGKTIQNSEIAGQLLPNTPGLFFGSTEYDYYYIDQLKETIEMLEPLLTKENKEDWRISFYYESSW